MINLKSKYWAFLGFQLHISYCYSYQTWKLFQRTTFPNYCLLKHSFPSLALLHPLLPSFLYHYLDWSSPFLPRQHQSFSLPLVLFPCLCHLHFLIIYQPGNNVLPITILRIASCVLQDGIWQRPDFVFQNGFYQSHRKALNWRIKLLKLILFENPHQYGSPPSKPFQDWHFCYWIFHPTLTLGAPGCSLPIIFHLSFC